MASYEELATEYGANTLINKITVAIMIAADTVLNENISVNGHDLRVTWAKQALNDPEGQARRFWAAILAANNGATIPAIQSATDITIQGNVDAAVNIFAGVTT